ncbi:TlpA family protein disulfide reductase [Pseudobacteriovorax antillogorgiicola]|uniref:Thiol-disulfide isomerase or thioredoxin n=1 Tax=Pseudobacteriovorax antillogorgiicola TaxID=1513793 RepID=A0A1Y6BNK7_9BACT|nr:TlpA disulfide reductase family protein [Pseudobacteriovorax antillogorgiicola]TCS54639.1 thiol-disulfide isomerase/thioredoxin [Pseudobacteriovorax antillogorgiicola]SMF17049.1 Thiol-disulfide isomerase or thioredoxin [Pseudobacteriovorax antillogorgiicola]
MKSVFVAILSIPLIYLALELPKYLNIPKTSELPSLVNLPAQLESKHIQVHHSQDKLFIWWIENSTLKFSRLDDGIWQQPVAIPSSSGLQINWLDQPHFTYFAGSYYGVFLSGKAKQRRFQFVTSRDGQEWHELGWKTNHSTHGELGFAKLASHKGELIVLWLEGGENQTQLVASNLKDQKKIVLDRRVCDCCPLGIYTENDGNLIIAYRDRGKDENRTITVAALGSNYELERFPIEQPKWITESCPMNGPALSRVGKHLGLAWYTEVNGSPSILLAWKKDGGPFETYGPIETLDSQRGRLGLAPLNDEFGLLTWVGPNEMGKGRIWSKPISVAGQEGPLFELAAINLSHKSGIPQLVSFKDELYLAWTSLGRKMVMMRRFVPGFFKYNPDVIAPPESPPSRLQYENLSFTDLDGKRRELGKGQQTLLVFWASWCKPCLDEIPTLNEYVESRPKLNLLSINLDDMTPEELQSTVAKLGIRYPVIADDKNELQAYFNVQSLPTAIMLDQASHEMWRIVGKNESALQRKMDRPQLGTF